MEELEEGLNKFVNGFVINLGDEEKGEVKCKHINIAETVKTLFEGFQEMNEKSEKGKEEKSEKENSEKENEEKCKHINIAETVKTLFEGLIDENTKELINERGKVFNEYLQKMKDVSGNISSNIPSNIPPDENIDILVQQKQSLNKKISELSPSEQKEFYSKLYDIPTEKDIHVKLDSILEKIEDLQSEIAIMRKQIHDKQL